jgi:hypothetical protein
MIKNCEGFEELCTFFAAGAATVKEEKHLFTHIVSCRNCESRLHALYEVSANIINGLSPVLPPASIAENLLNTIKQEKRLTPRFPTAPPMKKKSFFARFPWLLAMGWVLSLILGILLLEKSGVISFR